MTERLSASEFQARYGNPSGPKLRPAKPSQPAPALESAGEGEALGAGRPLVRFTLCRVRLLDADAKYSSIKDLLDALQYAGAIRGDREDQICLEVEQVKVGHYAEQRTEITIVYP